MTYDNRDCTARELHTMSPDNSGNYDNCKEWCVARDDCGGIVIHNGKCYLKDTNCIKKLGSSNVALILLKIVN